MSLLYCAVVTLWGSTAFMVYGIKKPKYAKALLWGQSIGLKPICTPALAAVVLYEAQRQREVAGMYAIQQLSEEECQRVLFEGGFPVLSNVCKSKGLAYPRIDDGGNIVADTTWWQKMQTTAKAMRQFEQEVNNEIEYEKSHRGNR